MAGQPDGAVRQRQSKTDRCYARPKISTSLRAEALAVLGRGDEGFDHLRRDVVSIEGVQLREPEVVALEVERRFGRGVRVSLQVAEVLHEHERAVLLLRVERRVLGD